MSNENLKPQKIKVASNLPVESRVITADEPGSKFSYPESTSEGVSEYENSNETSSESEGEETSKTMLSKKREGEEGTE